MADLSNARQANRLFIARLEAETATLEAEVFPGRHPGPYKWLAIIRGLIDTAGTYLDRSEVAAMPGIDQKKLINESAKLGQFAYDQLVEIRGAESGELPHQVVRPLQRWLDDLGICETTFFRADHVANFELARWEVTYFKVTKPSAKLQDALLKIQWPIYRITVPSKALGMFPYYALVAHEAGHAIYPRVSLDVDSYNPNASEALVAAIQARIKQSISPTLAIELIRIVSSWVEELAADAIAYHIVGPAYFFAAFGFFQMCPSGYGLSKSHPPHDLRREILYSQLGIADATGHNFKDVFATTTGVALTMNINSAALEICPADPDQLYNEIVASSRYDSETAAILTEVIAYVRSVYSHIFSTTKSYLETNCPKLVYTPQRYNFDLSSHLDALCNLIPPIEYKDQASQSTAAADLATALNVGWVALLTKLDKISVQKGQYGSDITWKMERLHSLLIKAVELAEAKRSWDEAI